MLRQVFGSTANYICYLLVSQSVIRQDQASFTRPMGSLAQGLRGAARCTHLRESWEKYPAMNTSLSLSLYIYIYMYICICHVCPSVRPLVRLSVSLSRMRAYMHAPAPTVVSYVRTYIDRNKDRQTETESVLYIYIYIERERDTSIIYNKLYYVTRSCMPYCVRTTCWLPLTVRGTRFVLRCATCRSCYALTKDIAHKLKHRTSCQRFTRCAAAEYSTDGRYDMLHCRI